MQYTNVFPVLINADVFTGVILPSLLFSEESDDVFASVQDLFQKDAFSGAVF
jgi:hypothetical protein